MRGSSAALELALALLAAPLRRAEAAAVRCLGIPAGCKIASVAYTKNGASDSYDFGSPTTGEWFLDIADQHVTAHWEDPRAGDGSCGAEFETVGVDCACSHTRAEMARHDADTAGGQDKLAQLEAAAGFTFATSEQGGVCYTTDQAQAAGGWTADVDCPGRGGLTGNGGIGYAKTCPKSTLQLQGEEALQMSILLKAFFVFFVAGMVLVVLRVCVRKKSARGTHVAQPNHMTAAVP